MSNSPAGEASVPAPKKLERSASTFTVTCNLLSQFLKDRKGAGFGDLALGIASRNQDSAYRGKTETPRTPPTTMSLLPGPGVDGETGNASRSVDLDLFPLRASFAAAPSPAAAAAENAREAEKNQLTIFYGGKVLVFDNFPANKAMDLLNLASKKSPAAENHTSTAPAIAADPPKSVSLPNTTLPSLSVTPPAPAVQPTSLPSAGGSEMPIARRASLHRFLEKRKDRVNSKAPYEGNGGSGGGRRQAAKPEESMKWLGLGPQSSKS